MSHFPAILNSILGDHEGNLVSILNAFSEPGAVSIVRGLPEVKLVLAGRENRAQKGA
jgi:hypothetical protein